MIVHAGIVRLSTGSAGLSARAGMRGDADQVPGRVAERGQDARSVGGGLLAEHGAGALRLRERLRHVVDVDPHHGPGVGGRPGGR